MASSLLPPSAEVITPRAAPPRLRQPVPLRGSRRRVAGARRVLPIWASLLAHAAAIVLLVVFFRFGPREVPAPRQSSGSDVVFLDLSDFPAGVPDGLPAPGGASAAAAAAPTPAPAAAPSGVGPASRAESRVAPAPASASGPRGVLRPGQSAYPAGQASGGSAGRPGQGATGAAGRPGAGGQDGAAAGRLGGGWRDPRLIPTPRELPPERPLTEHERYMAQLAERLAVYNDSVAADAERARRSTDWTHTDKDGKKWGVSPGKIHLGGVTIPAPVGFSAPGEQQDEIDRRARQRVEIDRQVDDAQRRKALEAQNRETRERRDRERAERAGDG